jgi:hypothetical protein
LYVGPQKPYNVTITANLEPDSTISACLEWNVPEYSDTTGTLEYFITISPPDPVLIISSFKNTIDTSLLLNLRYDQEYHVRIVVSNCIGNSIPIIISIGELVSYLSSTLTLNL